jgi:predicted kinase
LSSDSCRALVCDDENNQEASNDAFELLHLILAKRMARRRTTVVDATNVQPPSRTSLVSAAAQWNIPAIAIVFLLPEEVCQRRNLQRAYRRVPADVIQKQIVALAASNERLDSEGFLAIHRLNSEAQAADVTVVRQSEGYS